MVYAPGDFKSSAWAWPELCRTCEPAEPREVSSVDSQQVSRREIFAIACARFAEHHSAWLCNHN